MPTEARMGSFQAWKSLVERACGCDAKDREAEQENAILCLVLFRGLESMNCKSIRFALVMCIWKDPQGSRDITVLRILHATRTSIRGATYLILDAFLPLHSSLPFDLLDKGPPSHLPPWVSKVIKRRG